MQNPFDDEKGEFLVLINDVGQHSLWPGQFPIPPGWNATGPRGGRKECLDWIDLHWDMGRSGKSIGTPKL